MFFIDFWLGECRNEYAVSKQHNATSHGGLHAGGIRVARISVSRVQSKTNANGFFPIRTS